MKLYSKIFRSFLLLVFGLLTIPGMVKAQMNINIQDPMNQAFLNEIIHTLVGNGVYVTPGSVSISGNAAQIATYNINGTTSNIPFSKGVILSTSFAQNIAGADVQSEPLSNQVPPIGASDPGDPLLSQFTPNNIRDAITLEFRFRPQSTPLVFRYGIATEEYPAFVTNEDFNDVFGFFITGENPSGGNYTDQNIAILPNGQVAGVYNIFSNITYMMDTRDNPTHQFNAVSTAFSCSLNVVPCTDYVIKIKICDVSDESFDSAVFLQANSFGSIPVSLSPLTANGDSSTIEGCAPAKIVASKNHPSLLNQEVTIPLTISGTATNGTDYTGLPESIVIPAGQTSNTVTINALADNLAEPDESIIIAYPSSCGFFDTISLVIREKPLIIVTPGDSPSMCAGAGPVDISAAASGGIGPYTYSWSNGAGDSLISVNPAVTTDYVVTATDACGGTGTATVTVNVVTHSPPPQVQSNSPVCATFDLNLNCPETAESYTWSGPGGWIKTGAAVTRTAMTPLQAGTYSLQIIKNGCPSSLANFEVVVFDSNFAPPAASNSPVCAGKTLTLQTGVSGATKYIWTGPGGFSANEENPEISPAGMSEQGDYQVYFIAGTCTSATATVQVQVKPTPLANAGLDFEVCAQQVIAIGTPAEPGVSYTWMPSTGLDNPNTANPQLTPLNVTQQAQTQAFLLNANLNGCIATDTVKVLVKPVPVAGFPTPAAKCFRGNSFDFNAQGNYPPQAVYEWDFGPWATPNTGNTRSVTGVQYGATGNHPVSLKIELDGCTSNVFTNNIQVLEMPVANFTANKLEGCEPLPVLFENHSENTQQNLRYLWDFGNGFASTAQSPNIIFSKAGRFTVSLEVTNSQGCTDKYEVPMMIAVYPTPVARFALSKFQTTITEPLVYMDDLSRFADTCVYLIERGTTVIDSVQAFDASYAFRDSGLYTVTQRLTNRFGCSASFERNVKVDLGFKIYIPTAFTPNSDDKNDYFRAYGEDISTYYIRIYNRWGQLIYQSWDMANGWDGTSLVDGKVVPGGSYLYLIRLKDKYGKDYSFDGTIHVLR
ncbi:MAG: choice-of-anchor L domain-containing protein [Bacteroidia bacterium]|nr:choice-of-anchor L domain-containing protein [Bacteroidia bacterium]